MRGNFEFALDHVKPGYLIALGGDDGILPYGISRMASALKDTGMEIVTWVPPIFTYPGVRHGNGQLRLNRPGRSRLVRSSAYLARQAKALHYLSDRETPMFYIKGVVATRLVEQVRSRTEHGQFYVCSTPDGFSGIVLAGEVEQYAFSGMPLTIAGESPTSQGHAYMSDGEESRTLSNSFYSSVSDVPMHPDLASQPYSPLISLMTADYLLSAKSLPGWPGRFPDIDYKNLLLKSLTELSNGLYAAGRVNRELGILDNIAQHHGLGPFFRQNVKNMRRGRSRMPFTGNGITPSQVLLDCDMLEIRHVFDAAYFCYFADQVLSKFNLAAAARLLADSLKYKVQQLQRGDRFAPESKWTPEA
jgi:hypothetical protein